MLKAQIQNEEAYGSPWNHFGSSVFWGDDKEAAYGLFKMYRASWTPAFSPSMFHHFADISQPKTFTEEYGSSCNYTQNTRAVAPHSLDFTSVSAPLWWPFPPLMQFTFVEEFVVSVSLPHVASWSLGAFWKGNAWRNWRTLSSYYFPSETSCFPWPIAQEFGPMIYRKHWESIHYAKENEGKLQVANFKYHCIKIWSRRSICCMCCKSWIRQRAFMQFSNLLTMDLFWPLN